MRKRQWIKGFVYSGKIILNAVKEPIVLIFIGKDIFLVSMVKRLKII